MNCNQNQLKNIYENLELFFIVFCSSAWKVLHWKKFWIIFSMRDWNLGEEEHLSAFWGPNLPVEKWSGLQKKL